MSTLLLRLAAPLQSWGISSKFERRGTEQMPSKSAIIGMVSAALGRDRDADIKDLHILKFGVRIDQQGKLLKDYHTVKTDELKRTLKKSKKDPNKAKLKDDIITGSYVTYRYYLTDAAFLVGLEGEMPLLTEIKYALENPVFPLFLGRRSCPPAGRLVIGDIREESLLDALSNEPWLASKYMQKKAPLEIKLPIFTDADMEDGNVIYQMDLPISFSQKHRKFAPRAVIEHDSVKPQRICGTLMNSSTNHDAMATGG